MSHAATATPRSPWIISPTWDLAYIVATPLAIVPIVLFLEQRVFTPAQILLFVTSFATLAHHLPGFMRAYGDRELFRRFRWRFILVPPLALATAIVFLPPPTLATRLELPWSSLDGLELLLLLWGTWHGLMQTFGFMRIYDMKRGAADAWTARLDFWLCVMLFVAGFVFSDGRVFGLMNIAWRTGLPIADSEWLWRTRVAVGAATVIVLLAYLVNVLRQSRSQQGVSWIKIALALTTGGLYWFSGRISTNLVIGIAMFEIFHAVQYYAIVWVYNRRLAQRSGERFGLLGFMFRDRWTMLGLYLASIAVYGSIRFLSGAPDDEDAIRQHADAIALLTALFNASTLLHFYFDGFIWKVTDRSTAANLDVADAQSLRDRFVPGLAHVAKWAAFYGVAVGLVVLQLRQAEAMRAAGESEDRRVFGALSMWTPELPEAQLQAARLAIQSENYAAAIPLAQRAVALRPRSHEAYGVLGEAQLKARQNSAIETFRRAIELDSTRWRYHLGLAQALCDSGKTDAAIAELSATVQQFPTQDAPRFELVTLLGQTAEAQLRAGHAVEARTLYERLVELAPDRWADRFRLGQLEFAAGDYRAAAVTFRRLVDQRRDEPKSKVMLAGALAELDQTAEAEKLLRDALAISTNDPEAHYNLGLLLLRTKRIAEAREEIGKARQLGIQPSAEVLDAIK